MFHQTESEKQLEELLKDADRVGSEIWRQISGGPNLQCIAAGHLRGPNFFELLGGSFVAFFWAISGPFLGHFRAHLAVRRTPGDASSGPGGCSGF